MSDDDGPDLSMFDFGDDDDSGAASKKPVVPAGEESSAAMQKRHRKEEQQLRTEAKAKQRDIPKGDRATRQAAEEELEASLQAMRTRHTEELSSGGFDDVTGLAAGVASVSVAPAKPAAKKKSKKQKAEDAERAREQRIADHHAGSGPSEREIEMGKLQEQLGPAGLSICDIPADGHCLYRSLAHEMQLQGQDIDFAQCRKDIAAYMRSHPADFLPYLAADGCDDIGVYCSTVESSTEWGGQLEITAFAHAKKRMVTVYSAGTPPLHTGEEYRDAGMPLELAYHRHYYGLGEHYNALARS